MQLRDILFVMCTILPVMRLGSVLQWRELILFQLQQRHNLFIRVVFVQRLQLWKARGQQYSMRLVLGGAVLQLEKHRLQ